MPSPLPQEHADASSHAASWNVAHGDTLVESKSWARASLDAVVTDPPYGLDIVGLDWDRPYGFMGAPRRPHEGFRDWSQVWLERCLSALKPGGHLLAFGSSRTYHQLAWTAEDVGFQVRDSIHWTYSSGMPKSRNLHDEHEGWGSTLKPTHEIILVARRRPEGTLEENMARYGVGALNVDACRVPRLSGDRVEYGIRGEVRGRTNSVYGDVAGLADYEVHPGGRWPTNTILSHDPDCRLQGTKRIRGQAHYSGKIPEGGGSLHYGLGDLPDRGNLQADADGLETLPDWACSPRCPVGQLDARTDHASRYFVTLPPEPIAWYTKAHYHDKDLGTKDGNAHPTPKPIRLMQYLVRLVTPRGGTVLDPFAGSGSTGVACALEGMEFVGVEQDVGYVKTCRERVEFAYRDPARVEALLQGRKVDAQTVSLERFA